MRNWSRIVISVIVLMLVCTAGVYGAGNIKVVIDGSPIDTGVIVRNGQIWIPVRAAAEVLGAKVRWDAGSQTVFVTPRTRVQTDVWDESISTIDITASMWISIRNLITEFIIAFDERDRDGAELVTPDFDSNIVGPEVVIPIGGIFPAFIDFYIADIVPEEHHRYKARVVLIQQEMGLRKLYWDFDVVWDKGYRIAAVRQVGEEELDEYEVVPGLTFRSEKIGQSDS